MLHQSTPHEIQFINKEKKREIVFVTRIKANQNDSACFDDLN